MADENHPDKENRGEGRENRGEGRVASYTGMGVALGTGAGTALFAATDDPVWIALGAALGAGLGAAFSSARDD
jgi:hypothetical protein